MRLSHAIGLLGVAITLLQVIDASVYYNGYYQTHGFIKHLNQAVLQYGAKHGTAVPPKIDVLFAVQTTRRYGWREYIGAVRAISQVTDYFSVSPGTTRVAFMNFGYYAKTRFTFDHFSNREAVKRQLYRLARTRLGRTSHLGAGIEEAAKVMKKSFTRPNSLKILIVFTDGKLRNTLKNRVSFYKGIKSLKHQHVVRIVFSYKETKAVKQLATSKMATFIVSRWFVKRMKWLIARNIPRKASYRYCSKYYGKVLDECNRVCDCRYGYITDCRRVRKEANLMPLKERERFVQTYLTLTSKQPYKARYEEFIKVHSRIFNSGIHTLRQFLPWHRWYTVLMENLLKEVDCRVTIPYWDWSRVSEDPWNNKMLFNDEAHGFSSHPVRRRGCVQKGPFGIQSGWTLQTGGCLQRWFSGNPPSQQNVTYVMRQRPFTRFEVLLRVALHDSVHCMLGPTMCSSNSANSPTFFLHHAFVDKIWWDAQQLSREMYNGVFRKNYNKLIAYPKYRVNQMLNNNRLPGSIRIEYQEPRRRDSYGRAVAKHTGKGPMMINKDCFKVFHVSKAERAITEKYWYKITGGKYSM